MVHVDELCGQEGEFCEKALMVTDFLLVFFCLLRGNVMPIARYAFMHACVLAQ